VTTIPHVIVYFINILTLLVPILIAIAFLTLVECKILGYIQLRKGPNIVGLCHLTTVCRCHTTIYKRTYTPFNSLYILIYHCTYPITYTSIKPMSSPTNTTPIN
uniref:NADH dehydrogenase subunit 1 n=1 Tax=Mus spicilegus TaxID=10103 RepID=A0A8C6H8D9_MUSSI